MTTPSIPAIQIQHQGNEIILTRGEESYTLTALSLEGQNTAQTVNAFVQWIREGNNSETLFAQLGEKLDDKEVSILKFDSKTRLVQTGSVAKGHDDAYVSLLQTATASQKVALSYFKQLEEHIHWKTPLGSSTTQISPTKRNFAHSAFMAVSAVKSAATSVATSFKTLLPSSPPSLAEIYHQGPAGIYNPDIACYRIAPIQALIASPSFVQLLQRPIQNGVDAVKREAIRRSFAELVTMLREKKADMQQVGQKEFQLKELILNYSTEIGHALNFVEAGQSYNKQYDAHDFVEFVLTEVLGQPNQYTKKASGISLQGETEVEVSALLRPDPKAVLNLHLKERQSQPLSELIRSYFSSEHVHDRLIIDNLPVEEFDQHVQFAGQPPPILSIRIEKEPRTPPITVPEENFDRIDLSIACGANPGTHPYAITSFLKRIQGAKDYGASGHFISYVKQGDQWYECDDARVTQIDETHVRQEMSGAYMFFLERQGAPIQIQSTQSA